MTRYGYALSLRETQQINRAGNCARRFLPKSHSSRSTGMASSKRAGELVGHAFARSTLYLHQRAISVVRRFLGPAIEVFPVVLRDYAPNSGRPFGTRVVVRRGLAED